MNLIWDATYGCQMHQKFRNRDQCSMLQHWHTSVIAFTRHFLFPALSIKEYNDRVTAVVRCEAQDTLLQKLLEDDYLSAQERLVKDLILIRAESEGIQPNHHNNMPNSISEEPINRLPSNFGGSAHQWQLFYMPNSSLEEPIHQLPSNLGGSAHQSDQFFPGSDVCYTVLGWLNTLLWKAITQLASSSNQGGSAHQPQLSEAQFLANELWRGLVQPNVNRGGWLSPTQSLGVQPNVNPGQSVPQDVNPGGRSSPTQSLGVQPNVNPGQSVPQDVNPGGRLSPTQSEDLFDIRITTLEPRSFATQVLRWFKILFWKTIAQLVAYVEKVRDAKLKHESAVELVNYVCQQLSSMSFQEIMDFLQNPKNIMSSAVIDGIEEIVRALFQNFPDLIDLGLMPEGNILQTAIKHRQEKIVNIIKENFPTATKNMSENLTTSDRSTILQLEGELEPIKLLSVPGAALQMQREWQWFKEVKEIERVDLWDLKNEHNRTAEDVFRETHKELAKEGEEWMKKTAESCMLVSILIATVLFAAAFTVPGGNTNDDKGIPIFLRTSAFKTFVISDALGLFFSLTSLLMFLAIMTARYELEEFHESLPKKLIIGLGSLFVSIATMIIAFVTALTITSNERRYWFFVPISLVPAVTFAKLQLPLFFQMVQSTYRASMFHP
ncbi:hypothetical protein LWI29_009921 [Acer saccharum]|uniref:PGG domain-containing protein n=1 Tax=Acer saccharum TaxID=4024 RepID=A0AA39VYW7_ACESA|nr:hypothetical protein LWI29_009921 [Acer saccharum]